MSSILVTGGTGMIGNALQNILKDKGIYLSSKDCDLTDLNQTMKT